MKKLFLIGASLLFTITGIAQQRDTVVINLAKTSKIIFTIEDKKDLDILKHYDFQQLFEDVLKRLESQNEVAMQEVDSTKMSDDSTDENAEVTQDDEPDNDNNSDVNEAKETDGDLGHYENDEDDDEDDEWSGPHGRWNRTWQTFNFDLGTNNYLGDDGIPSDNELYAVRPWGSWYVGLASVQRSRIGKKFFLEWGIGVSWYNFKFQNDNTVLREVDNGIEFVSDDREVDFKKSKLSASFVQASLIPVIDFGDQGRRPRFWDGYDNNAFRIGFGPYIGYRISSHTKLVYNEDGRRKDKDRDGFYLNNFRYGARLQVGYRSTDLFFNYDLNEMFQGDRRPRLNAFSFGVIF